MLAGLSGPVLEPRTRFFACGLTLTKGWRGEITGLRPLDRVISPVKNCASPPLGRWRHPPSCVILNPQVKDLDPASLPKRPGRSICRLSIAEPAMRCRGNGPLGASHASSTGGPNRCFTSRSVAMSRSTGTRSAAARANAPRSSGSNAPGSVMRDPRAPRPCAI